MDDTDSRQPKRKYNSRSRDNLRQFRQQQPEQTVARPDLGPIESPIPAPIAGVTPISSTATPNQHVARRVIDEAAAACATYLAGVAVGKVKVKHAAATKVRADVAFGLLELAGVTPADSRDNRRDNVLEMGNDELRAFIAAGTKALELKRARASAVDVEIVSESPAAS